MDNDKLLTVREVADILRLEEFTVREMCRDGRIPAVKIGRAYRIKESTLRALINPAPDNR